MKKKNLYNKGRILKPVIIAAFVVAAGIAALVSRASGEDTGGDIVISKDTETAETTEANKNGEKTAATEATAVGSAEADAGVLPQASETIPKPVVYICGEVNNPGLFECDPDARIADVVELAGGLLPEADETCVNMAARVTDAQQIVITKKGEIPFASGEAAAGSGAVVTGDVTFTPGNGLININTADEAALKTLPGIGDQKAKAIISYRQTTGSFSRIEDIMNVTGIKDGAFSKIKDLITV